MVDGYDDMNVIPRIWKLEGALLCAERRWRAACMIYRYLQSYMPPYPIMCV
jgi:hypothetical protein